MWQMTEQAHAVAGYPADLMQGNIFAGHTDVLAYSDNLIAFIPIFGPALWLSGGNPIAAYNAAAFLLSLGGSLAVYALARHLLDRRLAAFAAALLFTVAPYRAVEQLGHLQLMGFAFVPLGVLALMRLVERPRLREGAFLGIAAGLCWLSSLYCAMMLAISLPVLLLVAAVQRRVRFDQAFWVAIGAATAVAAACVLPTLPAYLRVQSTGANTRRLDELITVQAAEFRHLPPSPLWRLLLGHDIAIPGEQDLLFPGVITLGLAFLGAVVLIAPLLGRIPWRRPGIPAASGVTADRRRQWAVPLLLVALFAGAVMVGPRHSLAVSLPDRVLRAALPGMADLRDLVRFWLVVLAVIALAAGAGVLWLLRRLGPGWGVLAVLAVLAVAVSENAYRLPYASVDLQGPKVAVDTALRELPPGVVVELPLDPPLSLGYNLTVAPRQLRSTIDGHPRLEGYSGNMPADTRAAVETARLLPDAPALLTLRRLGVRYVVLHGGPTACWGDFSPPEMQAMVAALTRTSGVSRTIQAGADVVVVLDPAAAALSLSGVSMPSTPAPARGAPGCDIG